ncbi:MAG: hypothetical protein WC553_02305 [Patescibacteria group bacterium]|jgi:hypothetical protein
MKTFIAFIGLIVLASIGFVTYHYTKDLRQNLIGGQTDEHGCLVAAGYSWCEVKAKCIRTWEETCDINTTEHDIMQLFATKYNKSLTDIRVEFTETDATHIRGNISFAPFDDNNEGGMFLAVKVNNTWQLVYDGNGSVDCQNLAQYNFTTSMLKGMCD